MKRTSKRVMAVAVSLAMVLTGSTSALAATTNPEISDREIEHKTAAKNIAAQGMVLLENKNNSLPISKEKGTKIALFGQGVYNTIKGGTGSGAVNQRDNVTVQQGFENAGYDIVDIDFVNQMHERWTANGGGTSQGWSYKWVNEPIYEQTEGAVDQIKAAAEKTDTAIYVIARNSGEGSDRSAGKGDYLLSDDEEANLKLLGQNFENVVVVLNVGGIIDTKFFDEIDGLDSMLLMSQAGMTGGDALVEVLNGTVNPSGKLTDTWPVNFDDNPSSEGFANQDGNTAQELYNDDIFVRYRYYDTFGVDVSYPFGYGGSYTSFAMSTKSVKADKDKVTVQVKVKNTGTVSGKEVAEVYFSAPDGELDKPYQELAGYAKTDELAPGESQILTISFDTKEMGSYDTDKAAYVMEDGDYIIRVGNSSRNTHVAVKLNVAEDTITEQYSNLMVPVTENDNIENSDKYPTLEPMTTEGATSITYDGEANEIAAAKTIEVDFTGYKAPEIIKENEDVTVYTSDTTEEKYLFAKNEDGATGTISRVEKANANNTDYSVTYQEHVKKFDGDYSKNTLKDVYEGKISLEQFVSGLSLYELANLVNGHSSDKTVQGVAGATWKNDEKGFVPVNLSDGPAGLRITQHYKQNDTDYYQYATAWPIGTLLAQTWDTGQIYAYGEGVGEEMEEFGIGSWLAPGMNIHRNALCGRNFEYYSEDPVVVGVTGTAATLGVQKSKGVGVTIKHYALNSQETSRNSENNTVSERAIREIYLKGFEMVVKQAQPMAIMTSYNQNNGRPAADDYDLCTAFARDEWGFKGMIMTDWGGGQSVPMYEMHAGNDLVCPGKGYSQIMKGFINEPAWTSDGYVELEERSIQDVDASGNPITVSKMVPNFGGYKLDLNGNLEISTTVAKGVELNEKVAELKEQGYITSVTTNSRGVTTVTYKVSMDDGVESTQVISLGDLQKAAINICNFIMNSIEFANANDLEAKSLNELYADALQTITSYEKDDVVPSTTYSTITEGYDWGPAISKVVVNVGKAMSGNIDASAFEVNVTRKALSGFLLGPSRGTRNVTAAYVSDANGNKAATGNYITLELEVGPDLSIGSPFNYNFFGSGHNEYVDTAYEVTLNKELKAADGSSVNFAANKFAADTTRICDDFDLDGKFSYNDEKFGQIALTYASYTPEAAKNDGKKNALIIWLHGAGEGGTDPRVALLGNKVVNLATDTVQQYFDGGAYVLAAQCPTMWMDNGSGQYTSDGTSKYTAALMELIKAYVNSNSDIDASRVYIGGCSNGGFMTMNMIVHYPKYFAAAYPVCEAYTNDALTDEMVESIKDMPIWFTHAKNDPTVKIGTIDEDGNFVSNGNYSPKAYERLTEAGGSDIHFSLFDDVHDTTGLYKRADGTPYQYNGHWSWLYTLNNECKENIDGEEVTIWQWISTKSKTNRGLEKVIAKVNALNAEDYTADSWTAVQSALAAAKAVAADQNATRTQINAAMEELVAAYSKLEYGVQKLHLEVAVEEAEKILAHPENYEDIAALKAALESGKAVLEDKDADQTAVDAAAEAILAELNKVADKADVKSLVNLIESAKKLLDGNYTSDSLKDLKAAIKKAEDVIANPNRTEAEIGTVYADLINAILNLQMKANKAALKAILDKANEVLGNADAYVAATIDGLDAAAAEAQTVYDNTDALQDDVDAAVRALTRKVADARLLGDVDNDGEVTTADSVALLAASAEIISLDADAAAAADVNGDDVADTNDAVLILQYAAEKVTSF